jgi:hypothetical protein
MRLDEEVGEDLLGPDRDELRPSGEELLLCVHAPDHSDRTDAGSERLPDGVPFQLRQPPTRRAKTNVAYLAGL